MEGRTYKGKGIGWAGSVGIYSRWIMSLAAQLAARMPEPCLGYLQPGHLMVHPLAGLLLAPLQGTAGHLPVLLLLLQLPGQLGQPEGTHQRSQQPGQPEGLAGEPQGGWRGP